MLFTFDASMTLQSFFDTNKQLFEQTLVAEEVEIRSDIRLILQEEGVFSKREDRQ